MSKVTLPWNDGSGQSLEATFSGTGNGRVSLSSPRNSTGVNRSLTVTISVLDNPELSYEVVVTQKSGDQFLTLSGKKFITKSSKDFLVVDPV